MPVATIPTGTYAVDPAHSNVTFEIKHMGIATVRGSFATFAGTLEASDLGLTASGTVQVTSVDTGQPDRDGHLQSPDFFDAAQFPEISYRASSAEVSGEEITLTGEITIHGVTQPVELRGTVGEGGEDPWGNERIGIDVAATIDREAFGLTFNQTTKAGNLLVANKVKLLISVSAVKAA